MKKWTPDSIKKFLNEVKQDTRENGESFDDSQAFDIAQCLLEELGLEKAIRTQLNIKDPVGYVANFIY